MPEPTGVLTALPTNVKLVYNLESVFPNHIRPGLEERLRLYEDMGGANETVVDYNGVDYIMHEGQWLIQGHTEP